MEDRRPGHRDLPDPPPLRIGVVRTLVRLAFIAGLAVVLHLLFVRAEAWIASHDYGWAMPGLLLAALVIYALLIAIPFVPGVEIGLSVLAAGGAGIAPLVWLATAAGLILAYAAGCAVPLAVLRRVLGDLHMRRAAQLVDRFAALPPEGRAAFVHGLLPENIAAGSCDIAISISPC